LEKTALSLGLAAVLYDKVVMPGFTAYCAAFREDICSTAIPLLFDDKLFNPGFRWWGISSFKRQTEIYIVSASADGREMIIGEAKWSGSVNPEDIIRTYRGN
jgi:hypothetical protein